MKGKEEKIKVEIETHSGNFYIHKHKTEDVDEVLCVVLDKELPVKTIKLNQLIMWYQLPEDELLKFFKNAPDQILKDNRTNRVFWHFRDTWFYVDKLYHEYGLCNNCDYLLPPWANFCFVCGAYHKGHGKIKLNFPMKYKSCENCYFPLPLIAKYCTSCGKQQNQQ